MRYFFFKTSIENRDGSEKPTLRALPGQTFDDGTPVSTELNVKAPKEAGSAPGGARLDYPTGTYFCSDHLELVTTSNGVDYYSVYKKDKKEVAFHPVSDDPAFPYKEAAHRDNAMNAAYVKFIAFGEQEVDGGTGAKAKSKSKPAVRLRPMDANGKATAMKAGAEYVSRYDEQVPEEARLIVIWMRRMLNDINVLHPAVTPKASAELEKKVAELYACGETIDYIASRERFSVMMKDQKVDAISLQSISKGPLNWYIDEIAEEHRNKRASTAVQRDPKYPANVNDAALMLNTRMNDIHARSANVDDNVIGDLTKALSDGWTLDEILEPDILAQRDDLSVLASALASGTIPQPEREKDPSKTFIGQLFANRKNARPTDKDGFHVDELPWTILVRNLYRRQATLITGPTGSGKTEAIRLLCERTGTPLTIIPMGTITDPTEQLIGKMDLDPATGGTKFDWADFALAVQRPGVILLDEINRCPRNGNNILFSILDGTATLTASGAKSTDQRNIKVNPDCVFFATANIGAEYTDTSELDAATRNRFMEVKLDYLPVDTEASVLARRTGVSGDEAKTIARIAASIRKSYKTNALSHPVSMRETLICASLIKDGLEPELACEAAFLPSYDEGVSDQYSEQGTVKALIASQFNSQKS